MFARTERLTLRPGWPEDAPALAAALDDAAVVRNLAQVPSPYTLADAHAWLGQDTPAHRPLFLIFAHDRAGAAPSLAGGIGLGPFDGRPWELGYWIARAAWNRGYATEAVGAVLDIARGLGLRQVTAAPFADNPASAAVLRKLGFRATGTHAPVFSQGRGEPVMAIHHVLDLAGPSSG